MFQQKCSIKNVPTKMFHQKCSNKNVPSKMFQQKCSNKNLPTKMFQQKSSNKNVPTKMFQQKCSIKNVPTKMFHQKCSNKNVPSKMFQQKCSNKNVPTKMFHQKCTNKNVPSKMFNKNVPTKICQQKSSNKDFQQNLQQGNKDFQQGFFNKDFSTRILNPCGKILVEKSLLKTGFFFMLPPPPPRPSGTSATVAQGTSYIPMSVNFLLPLYSIRHKFLSAKVSACKRDELDNTQTRHSAQHKYFVAAQPHKSEHLICTERKLLLPAQVPALVLAQVPNLVPAQVPQRHNAQAVLLCRGGGGHKKKPWLKNPCWKILLEILVEKSLLEKKSLLKNPCCKSITPLQEIYIIWNRITSHY